MSAELSIIYEDKYIIVCYKEAGLAVQTKRLTEMDLEHQVLNYCSKTNKQPFLGLIHRLDQPVEGLVMFAKDKKTAAALSSGIDDPDMGKYYLAVVEGSPNTAPGEWISLVDYLYKDGKTNTSRIASSMENGAKRASLKYQLIRTGSFEGHDISLLKIKLETGRHHQIRVQLSNAGLPLVGDKKYNAEGLVQAGRYPALCAQSLSFTHPVTKKKIELECQPKGQIFHQI